MKTWFLWAGISFIVGGLVSFALVTGATASISFQEDISGYSIAWILVGIILASIGFLRRKK